MKNWYPDSSIDMDAELVSVITYELIQQSKEIGKELTVNFEMNDYDIKIYAKPFEE